MAIPSMSRGGFIPRNTEGAYLEWAEPARGCSIVPDSIRVRDYGARLLSLIDQPHEITTEGVGFAES